MSTRVAAIDCGTNSIRLLITDLDQGNQQDLIREMRVVRLGQDLDQNGFLAPEALQRTFAAAEEYAKIIHSYSVDRIRFCATSAARDAENAEEFSLGIAKIIGVEPEIMSGADEAYATYLGAARALAGHDDPSLVVDLGGGSTEFVLGEGSKVIAAQSLDIGCVRMTERHLKSDPPNKTEIAAARADIAAAMDSCFVDFSSARTVVGVAGTMTTIAAEVLGLASYQADRIHRSELPKRGVLDACRKFLQSSVAQRRAFGYMHPGRADVIGGGSLIVAELMNRVNVDVLLVSESDILDGIALGALET